MGRSDPASFGTTWAVVKTRAGFESAIWRTISRGVLRGLLVVIIAPRDITARQTMGKKMEFGAMMRTTWPFRIPKPDKQVATESTACHNSLKERWRPVAASMKAVLPW